MDILKVHTMMEQIIKELEILVDDYLFLLLLLLWDMHYCYGREDLAMSADT